VRKELKYSEANVELSLLYIQKFDCNDEIYILCEIHHIDCKKNKIDDLFAGNKIFLSFLNRNFIFH